MSLRQVPTVVATVLLGLGLAQVDDARREPDAGRLSAQSKSHKSVVEAASQNASGRSSTSQSPGSGQADNNPRAALRDARGRGREHRWGNGAMYGAMYGGYSGPYGLDGPFVYWAPGRWYAYPGFGDERYWMPHPEGVWGR